MTLLHGATSVGQFQEQGYLSKTMVGWCMLTPVETRVESA
jgi:hypothetical protein